MLGLARRWRSMRIGTAIKLILAGIFLLACGVGIKLVARHTSPEHLMLVLRREAERSLNARLDLASVRLDLTGTLHLDGLALTLAGQEEPLLRCPKMVVDLDRSELLHGRAVVSKVILVQPTLNLSYDRQANAWNFEAPQLRQQDGSAAPAGLLSGGVVLEGGTAVVRNAELYGDDEPRTYDGLYATLARDSSAADFWRVDARFRTGVLAGTSVQGWFAAAQQPRYAFTARCEDLSAGEDLWRAVAYERHVWEEYEVTGRLGFEALLRSSPEGRPQYSVRITALDASARSDLFPARVSSISGVVEVAEGEAAIKDLTGLILPGEFGADAATGRPARLRLNATCRVDGPGGLYQVAATDLPLCQRTIEAIPDVGRDLWERLRPSGKADVTLTLREPAAGGSPAFSGVADIRDVTVRPAELARPLEGIGGRVLFDTDGVRLENVRGTIGDAGSPATERGRLKPWFVANGTVGAARAGTDLRVALGDVATDEALVKCIPGRGEQIWDSLRPEVILNADVSIRQEPGQEEPVVRAELDLAGGTLSPQMLPVSLQDVNGRIWVDQTGALLSNLRGVVPQGGTDGGAGPAHVIANGTVHFDGGGGSLELVLRNVRTNEELVRAVPEAGDDVWELLRPEVDLDAVVLLSEAREPGRHAYRAVLNLHGGRMTPAPFGMPVDNVTGTVRVDRNTVSLEHLVASVDTGGEPNTSPEGKCTVEVRGFIEPEAERAELDVAAHGFVLTDKLLDAIPNVGERIREAAQPHGTLSLNGKILYDGSAEEPLRYMLNVDVYDASLTLKRLPLDALSGRLLVTRNRVESRDFSGSTCGGHFEGALAIRYNAIAEPATYRAEVRFDRVDLAELIGRLTGESRDIGGLMDGDIEIGGTIEDLKGSTGEGRVSLSEGNLWQTTFFVSLLNLLHLAIPTEGAPSVAGQASFRFARGNVEVEEFELVGDGLNLSGQGTVGLDGKLALTMVAVGAPTERTGIPVISSVVGWALKAVERELLRIDVSGTFAKPEFRSQVLSQITWPLTKLGSVLYSPFVRGEPQNAKSD